jgi:protocatechuate 3,4-dioxygenase, beta subunit
MHSPIGERRIGGTMPRSHLHLDARRLARRHVIAGVAALLAAPALIRDARAQATRRLTPSQTEGPFYPVTLPADTDFDLLANGSLHYTQGQAAWLDGAVLDTAGRAVRGAVVEIWQCDQHGHYHHPGDGGGADAAFQGFGRVAVSTAGEYRFRTIVPVAYPGRTPHIHVKVRLAGRELLTTQLYVEGEARNERDMIWRGLAPADRAAVTAAFKPAADGLQARFEIIVRA